MDKTFVERFMGNKPQLESSFRTNWPSTYEDIVTRVCEVITSGDYRDIDPTRVHSIDDGDYQGTLVFLIAAKGYQPSYYWFVKVSYGSCSGCDTLESIRPYSSKDPDDEQIGELMTLALHIVQGIKPLGGDEV